MTTFATTNLQPMENDDAWNNNVQNNDTRNNNVQNNDARTNIKNENRKLDEEIWGDEVDRHGN